MMQSGTRVRLRGSDITGAVAHMRGNGFEVHWDGDKAGELVLWDYQSLFNTGVRNADIEIVQPDIPLNVALTNIGSARTMAMSYNIGRMEATIEILYDRIMRMREAADIKGRLDVVADCDAMLNTISTCASRLRDLPSVDGGSKASEPKVNLG